MSAEIPDVEAYLTRIGYGGSHAATLETLSAIHRLHAQAIAFENLDPLLRRPVRLDLPALEEKLVRGGRGGWCFEHNLLLKHVLEHLGFDVTGLAARVIWNAREGSVGSRAHMLLLVGLDEGPHIADVGFGGLTLTGPLRLEKDIEQATPHERFRLVDLDGDLALQAWLAGAWKSLYRFDLQRQFQADYEVSSWYLANHPQSHFLANLMVARTEPGRRFALSNNQFTIHELNGESRRRVLTRAA
ncbi:MAG TPA: arylamine N-acetyltransferase, partial [Steroidobacteraceae bacterium]|nr:arylamine N-acetyltransferase [Steroidobacteraceae bacterium]